MFTSTNELIQEYAGLCYSDLIDDIILHIAELLLRLATSSSSLKTTTDQLLLVSTGDVVLLLQSYFPIRDFTVC